MAKTRERSVLKRDVFIKRVTEIGELQSRDQAERAIKATFETLKERLAPAEFYRRVAEREGIEETGAIRHARAAALVLQEAVTTGEMNDIRDQLKDECAELFGRKGE